MQASSFGCVYLLEHANKYSSLYHVAFVKRDSNGMRQTQNIARQQPAPSQAGSEVPLKCMNAMQQDSCYVYMSAVKTIRA